MPRVKKNICTYYFFLKAFTTLLAYVFPQLLYLNYTLNHLASYINLNIRWKQRDEYSVNLFCLKWKNEIRSGNSANTEFLHGTLLVISIISWLLTQEEIEREQRLKERKGGGHSGCISCRRDGEWSRLKRRKHKRGNLYLCSCCVKRIRDENLDGSVKGGEEDVGRGGVVGWGGRGGGGSM